MEASKGVLLSPKIYRVISKRAKEIIGLLTLAIFLTLIENRIPSSSTLLRRQETKTIVYIPTEYDIENQRRLSLDLGNGNCKWQPPQYDVPETLDFHKTIITGFPSGDKRMIFTQMEALTGWPAKDEWDFEYGGMSNHPFIKANYPHHEGTWGWNTAGDQVVMMIRNIRKSMVEYHDILWDLGVIYHFNITDNFRNKFPPHTNPFHNDNETAWDEVATDLADLYSDRPPLDDFLGWRDLRVNEEIYWYGWFIDYWMEGGLMRDIYTHQITTPEHWNMLMLPFAYTREELDYDTVVGNETEVTPSYDPHCDSENGDVTDGCEPVAVISAEKLRDYTEGPPETTKIARVLLHDDRMGQHVIAPQAWDCIWEELIKNGKGLKTINDKPGFNEDDYNFSADMLEEMIAELTRLIDKYSNEQWNEKTTANRVVELLTEHRALIQVELDEVNSGVRKLGHKDFLGPKERALRKNQAVEEDTTRGDPAATNQESKDYSEYFLELDKMRWAERQREMKRIAIERAEKQREAQEQRTSENVVEDQADDGLQVVNKGQEEAQPAEPQAQEVQSSEENEPSQEAIDMDEYGLLEQEFSTEYDMSEQLEEVQEVDMEVEFSTEYDISEQLGEEEPRVPEVAMEEVEFSTEYDLLEHLGEEVEDQEPQQPQLQVQKSQEESNTESDILEERSDNALQRAIAMLRRTEKPQL